MYWTFQYFHPQFQMFEPQIVLNHFKADQQPQFSEQSVQKQNQLEKFSEIGEDFKNFLVHQLSKKSQNNKRKIWSDQEDQMLIEMAKRDMDWEEISIQLSQANPLACQRRFQRLMKSQALWTKQVDESIVKLREENHYGWPQIRKILRQTHSASEIRQRYENHLRSGIKRGKWEIEEDLRLIELQSELGNKWRLISSKLEGRTERQIKNRFCRTLLPILEEHGKCKKGGFKAKQIRF